MIGCKEIDDYITSVENGTEIVGDRVKKLCNLVKKAFANESIYVDREQLSGYIKIGHLMFEELYPWELFCTACELCTYTKENKPRWHWSLNVVSRGAGKDGMIAWWSLCLTSKYNKIERYDVDICANNEEQATRPVKDITDFLERPEYYERNKKSYHWTIEEVKGLVNKGRVKGHTNSPKGKDGLRSGCVICNELHQFADYGQIKVFFTGLGKKPCPRRISFTTNGELRMGVLDDYLQNADDVLNGLENDNGHFYFICMLDSKDEVDDEKNWHKANPSLKYNETLLDETRTEYLEWKKDPYKNSSFMTKRMNLPFRADEKSVVDYDYIKATNQPMIDLERKNCIVGVDLSKINDLCSVSAWFKVKEKRYVINHSWICKQSADWEKMAVRDKFAEWEAQGILTVVDDFEIPPRMIVDYIQFLKTKYNVLCVAIDSFRYALFARELNTIGFNKQAKNLYLVRPSDIAKVVPVMESLFLNQNLIVEDNALWRWSVNNTKVVKWVARTTSESDLGNQIYAKIDAERRKTDPFMSTVAAATCDLLLPEQVSIDTSLFRARTL